MSQDAYALSAARPTRTVRHSPKRRTPDLSHREGRRTLTNKRTRLLADDMRDQLEEV